MAPGWPGGEGTYSIAVGIASPYISYLLPILPLITVHTLGSGEGNGKCSLSAAKPSFNIATIKSGKSSSLVNAIGRQYVFCTLLSELRGFRG